MKIFLFIFLILLNFQHVYAKTTLDDLDHFVASVGGPVGLIDSVNNRNEYYRLLNDYFDDRLPRPSYDNIWRSLFELIVANPQFRDLLWRENLSPQGVEFQGLKGADRFDVKFENWIEYLDDFKSILSSRTKYINSDRVPTLIQLYEKMFITAEKNTNPVGRRKRKIELYESLEVSSEFTQLISFLALKVYLSPSVQSNLRTDNYEIISDQLNKLYQRNFLRKSLDEFSSLDRLLGFVAKALPQLHKLKRNKDKDIFVPIRSVGRNSTFDIGRTKSYQNYRTRRVQPLHALFTGPIHKECCGGSVISNYTDLEPRRFGLSLLSSTVTEFFEVDGKYDGVLRFIPFERKYLKVMTVDMMAPGFGKKFKEVLADGSVQWTTVFDLWLRHQWDVFSLPLVMSESLEGRNVGNPTIKFDSQSFKYGFTLGQANSFTPIDTGQVTALLNAKRPTKDNETNLISDFSNPDAGRAIMLRLPTEVIFSPECVALLAKNGDFKGLINYLENNLFPQSLILHIYSKFFEAIDSRVKLTIDDLKAFEVLYLPFNSIEMQNTLKDHLSSELYEKMALIWFKSIFQVLEDVTISDAEPFKSLAEKILKNTNSEKTLKSIEHEFLKHISLVTLKDEYAKDFYMLLFKLIFNKSSLTDEAQQVQTLLKRNPFVEFKNHNLEIKSCNYYL